MGLEFGIVLARRDLVVLGGERLVFGHHRHLAVGDELRERGRGLADTAHGFGEPHQRRAQDDLRVVGELHEPERGEVTNAVGDLGANRLLRDALVEPAFGRIERANQRIAREHHRELRDHVFGRDTATALDR